MNNLYISNDNGRDATVGAATLTPPKPVKTGLPGQAVTFKRYVATAETGLHEALSAAHGEDYGQALIDGDPEVDIEAVGREIGPTASVYLSSTGEVLYAAPQVVEVIFGPDGEERERRPPEDVLPNVKDAEPIQWSGRRMSKAAVVRKFAFRRTIQVKHVDGLTYDYLYAMAKDLHDAGEMVLLGAGKKGRKPLVFTTNGSPSRGFLEGRIDGEAYKLLLHLSHMELKRPEAT